MAYPYDREFFEPTYQPTPLAPSIGWSGDFYGIPQPTDHITHPDTLAYNGWRPAASNSAEWRPASWQQIEPVPNHYVGLPESKPRIVQPIESAVNKPFRCQICGKAFSQAANLTAHNRVHTGEKPFECPVCNRPFSQSSSLVTHRRTHSGERPYPCKHCDKAFTDSSTLTKHLRTHTGQKPYGCPLCSMRFTQSGNLHRHMKTHKH